jgi:hypothetical protein
MRSLSAHLNHLITLAEDVIRNPARWRTAQPPGFVVVAAEVRRVHALPAEATRTTRAGIVMCEAIEGFVADGLDHWQMLIGATLPILRREAYIAFRNEREMIGERADGR